MGLHGSFQLPIFEAGENMDFEAEVLHYKT